MSGFEMFCERCGKRYGSDSEASAGSLPLARRFLRAVGVGATTPQPAADAPFLRFCLACRGYSCPQCWNEDAGFCQTCVPLPEPAVALEHVHEPIAALAAEAPMVPGFDPAAPLVVGTDREAEPFATEAWAPWLSAAPLTQSVDAETEAVVAALEAVAEYEPEAMVVAEAESELVSEPVAVVAEAAPEQEAAVTALPEAEVEPILATAERPIEFVFAEEEAVAEFEAEAEVTWDWTIDPADTAAPAAAESVAEVEQSILAADVTDQVDDAAPITAADEEPVAAELGAADELGAAVEPVFGPPLPVYAAPIFRPLTPLGPIVAPPPPPPAAPAPRIQFEMPDAPPAFVIAPRTTPVARPVLPLGLFDGPGPAIRPCSTCELPVSAKARFCRRCGSAQG